MSRLSQAQPSALESAYALGGSEFALVDHYVGVARRMRAEAFAAMARKAFAGLARVFHIGRRVQSGMPRAA